MADAVRVSVVMPNYNYGKYIGEAVDSALGLDWPDVEVIVVDDGSTDDSIEVLAGYGDRITVIEQENSGPRVACNRGFAVTTGDLVVFLDSDDQLYPSLVRKVAEVWRPGVSKVQVQMQRVDGAGRAYGIPFPMFRSVPSPEELREWLVLTGAYPTPPGSGNVYARDFLEQLLPLDDSCGDATDSACLAAAPVMGDVLTIAEPLVHYRIHELNRSKLIEPDRFTRQIERAVQRQRMAERRLSDGAPPVAHDTRPRLLVDSVRSLVAPGPEPWLHQLGVVAWCFLVAIAPSPLAQRMIGHRFR